MIAVAVYLAFLAALIAFRLAMPDYLLDMSNSTRAVSIEIFEAIGGVFSPTVGVMITAALLFIALKAMFTGDPIGKYQHKIMMVIALGVFVVSYLGDAKHVRYFLDETYDVQYALMNSLPGSQGNGPVGMLQYMNGAMDGIDRAAAGLSDRNKEKHMEEYLQENADEERDIYGKIIYKAKRILVSPAVAYKTHVQDDGLAVSVIMMIASAMMMMTQIVFFAINAVMFLLNALLVAVFPMFAVLAIFETFRPAAGSIIRQYLKFWLTPFLAAMLISFIHLTLKMAEADLGNMDLLVDPASSEKMMAYILASGVAFIGMLCVYPIAAVIVNTSAGPAASTAGMIAGVVGSQMVSRGIDAKTGAVATTKKFSKFAPK